MGWVRANLLTAVPGLRRGGFRPAPRPRKPPKKEPAVAPAWTAPVAGKIHRFREHTKSEVRARVKKLTGKPLPKGFGLMIVRLPEKHS